MKKNIVIASVAFLSLTALTYALGTWDTGFRANDGTDTVVDINIATPVFDNLVVENAHGQDLFVPTKTFAEIKSMWENNPEGTCLYTETESIVAVSQAESFASHNEATCDVPVSPYGTGHPYINGRRFQVLTVESPDDLDAYINFRLNYSADELNENLKIFLQKEGGVTVPKSHFLALYNDGGSATTNGPDLDYNNDGIDDLYFITIDDVWEGAGSRDVSTASEDMIKLFSGTNYFRIEGYDASGEFSCESGVFTEGGDANSVSYSGIYSGLGMWFSNGRCEEVALYDGPFDEATIDSTLSGYRITSEFNCDGLASPWNHPDPDHVYINGVLYNIIAIYVPETTTGYLNFRGEYDGTSQLDESFYVYKQKAGGSPVTPEDLHDLYNDGNAITGGNPPIYDHDNDSIDDIERFFVADGDNVSTTKTWANVKTGQMTFFKGMNYMRIESSHSVCETGNYSDSGESVDFDSPLDGGESRVWITLN